MKSRVLKVAAYYGDGGEDEIVTPPHEPVLKMRGGYTVQVEWNLDSKLATLNYAFGERLVDEEGVAFDFMGARIVARYLSSAT